jgi:hypothetical protein
VRGQDLLELHERAHGGLLDPRDRPARRAAQPDGDRDRLLVVEQQRRHRRARAQAIPAGRPAERVDRVAERAQPLDIAADRAPGHAEPVGQLVAGPVAPRLQEREQLQQSSGGLRHDANDDRADCGQILA